MPVHRATGGGGLEFDIGMGIELREELAHIGHSRSEHEGLIAVVSGAEVSFAERARHGKLGNLLAIAEDSELRLAGQHLLPSKQRCLPAETCCPVVGEDLFSREHRSRHHLFISFGYRVDVGHIMGIVAG